MKDCAYGAGGANGVGFGDAPRRRSDAGAGDLRGSRVGAGEGVGDVGASALARLARAGRPGMRLLAAIAFASLVAACGSTAKQSARIGDAPPTRIQSLEVETQSFGDRVAVAPGERAVVALLAPMGQSRNALDTIGRSIANGAQLALNDIALDDIELRLYDTGATPQGASLAAEAAAADGAALILGPLLSRSASAVGPAALSAGLPVISFSTDAAIAGENVFLIGFLPSEDMRRVTDFAVSRGVSSFGALAPATLEGDVLLSAFQEAAAQAGGEILLAERYQQTFVEIEEGVRRYADAHKAISETRPITGVLLADGGQSLNSVAAYLPFFDVAPDQSSQAAFEPALDKARFLGVGKWNDPLVLREPSLRGGWFAGPDPALREQFAARYRAAFAQEPHALASLGYDAMAAAGAMVAEARRAGSRFPFSREAITSPIGFVGVNGVFKFNDTGLNERGLAVLEVGRDGFVVIDPAPTGFPRG